MKHIFFFSFILFCLLPATAQYRFDNVLYGAAYYHEYMPFFGKWACITENAYGKGKLFYIGTYPSEELLEDIIRRVAGEAQVRTVTSDLHFPLIVRSGKNGSGKEIHYIFNYSGETKTVANPYPNSTELLTGKKTGQNITLGAWDLAIMEN
jgi:beta-galactosidase